MLIGVLNWATNNRISFDIQVSDRNGRQKNSMWEKSRKLQQLVEIQNWYYKPNINLWSNSKVLKVVQSIQ